MKVQFSDLSGEKIRPVVVIGTDRVDDDVTVVFVTSSPPRLRYDVQITEWSVAGLLKPSTVRASKFLTVHKGRFLKPLGTLTDSDLQAVMTAVRSYLL